MKGILAIGAGAMLGNYVFEKFIVKKEDGSGFIELADGLGVDDAVRAAFTVAGVMVARKVMGA